MSILETLSKYFDFKHKFWKTWFQLQLLKNLDFIRYYEKNSITVITFKKYRFSIYNNIEKSRFL